MNIVAYNAVHMKEIRLLVTNIPPSYSFSTSPPIPLLPRKKKKNQANKGSCYYAKGYATPVTPVANGIKRAMILHALLQNAYSRVSLLRRLWVPFRSAIFSSPTSLFFASW